MIAKFRIQGIVSRDPFVHEKFAKLPVLVEANGRKSYYDVKAFDARMIAELGRFKPGDSVTVDGELMSESLKDGKNPVTDSRGKAIWVTGLKATAVKLDGAQPAPTRKAPPPPTDEADDTPF